MFKYLAVSLASLVLAASSVSAHAATNFVTVAESDAAVVVIDQATIVQTKKSISGLFMTSSTVDDRYEINWYVIPQSDCKAKRGAVTVQTSQRMFIGKSNFVFGGPRVSDKTAAYLCGFL